MIFRLNRILKFDFIPRRKYLKFSLMRKNSQATINASLLGVKPSQYIKFIEYMDSSVIIFTFALNNSHQKQENDVCSNLAQLCSPHSRISLSELDVPATKTLAKLYNKYTCRLISNSIAHSFGFVSSL